MYLCMFGCSGMSDSCKSIMFQCMYVSTVYMYWVQGPFAATLKDIMIVVKLVTSVQSTELVHVGHAKTAHNASKGYFMYHFSLLSSV